MKVSLYDFPDESIPGDRKSTSAGLDEVSPYRIAGAGIS